MCTDYELPCCLDGARGQERLCPQKMDFFLKPREGPRSVAFSTSSGVMSLLAAFQALPFVIPGEGFT